ncbi:MAG TPA: hypothetical protein VND93_05400 [Myxococcales bacterium]|nr:hypothetical protein [Myxococcales bacterium]
MGLDVNQLVQDMLAQMKPILGSHWNEVQSYAKGEADKLAVTLAKLEGQKLTGVLTEQQANILFDMQKNASSAVLAAVQGVGEEAAAKAMNAGLNAIKDPINKMLGFQLL